MSIFIFTDTLQFAAVSLPSAATGLGVSAMTTLPISLHYVLYIIPLIEHLSARH